jgi:hypothetical protein
VLGSRLKDRFVQGVRNFVVKEDGDWVGNLTWVALIVIAVIAVVAVVVAGINALGGRIDGDLDGVAP